MSTHNKDDHSHGEEKRGFLSGVFYGALIGTAVGLLMAPQSGIETRHLIREKGLNLKEQVEESAQEAKVRAEKLQQSSKEYLEGTKDRLERTAEAVVKTAQETWKEEQQAVPEFPEHLTTRINA